MSTIHAIRKPDLSLALCAALLGACAAMPKPPAAPAALAPPAGEVLVLEALATGVQVYECSDESPGAARYQWRFKGPEAQLFDRAGRTLGKHYGGPTWESPDGSKVVGELRTQAAAADPSAIPLLLLKAKASSGDGVFGAVRSIQRLETTGGRAPADGCSRETLAQVARVPYKAVYYFYGDRR